MHDVRRPSHRLDEDARRRLLRRYARERRPEDLEALVISYRALACSLARRYTTAPQGDADLEQAACEGLVKALRRFDPDRGTAFTGFAVPTIVGEVRRYLRDTTWPAHVPRRIQERVRAVRLASEAAIASGGRAPTARELAERLELPEEAVVEALTAAATTSTVSLEHRSGEGEEGLSVADRIGSVDPGFDQVECMTAIEDAFPGLDTDQQLVVQLHFGESLTQRQIAAELGLSRSHVGRLLGSALDQLRATVAA